MPKKIDISQMTTEEIVAYAERVRQQNRDRVKKHYENTIKADPERYEAWKQKCNLANFKSYHLNKVTSDTNRRMTVAQ